MSIHTKWAVAADWNGTTKVGSGRYDMRDAADLAACILSAKYGDQNFRPVEAGEHESSESVEQRIALIPQG
jgi:hypothetical protein